MDGIDGRLVHLPLGGQQQTGGQRSIVTGTQQLGQQRIRTLARLEGAPRLADARQDPPAQLLGRRLGEGHHQDLVDGQRQRGGTTEATLGIAVTQQQA